MSSNLIEFGETIAKSLRRCDNPGTRPPTPAAIRSNLFKCRDVAST
jgi:hypothetical protein